MKIPQTCADLMVAAALPFNEGNSLISRADKGMVVECFSKLYRNFGFGYLHSSDHYAALLILLEREPTFREVYDSYHGGSRNIDLARQKAGGGLRPAEWESWSPETRRLNVLIHLHGISKGSKIFDGKRPDPTPQKTRDLLLLWGGVSDLPSDPPAPPPPPVVTPPPPPPAPSTLSPAGLRAEEIWSVARPLVRLVVLLSPTAAKAPDPKVDQLWLVGKPLLVLLVEAWRRSFAR